MFENLFASYNKVSPPESFNKPSFKVEDEKQEELNPVAKTYVTSVIPISGNNSDEQDDNSSKKEQKKTATKKKTTSQQITLKGTDDFESAFNKAIQRDPSVAKYKNFLTKTAKRESGFNSTIQNGFGAPYYGYFQMGENEIKSTTGLTVDQFRNDPVAQIIGAARLYESNLNTIKKIGIYDLGRQKGYSDDALVSGAWMGGPGGVKKYLLGQGNPSDRHWDPQGKQGSSVGEIMNNWNNG